MKNTFVILLATLALVSCMQLESARIDDSDPEFKVSLTVGRTGAFDNSVGTKATMKTGWAVGDVIFVFFKGVTAPKYLEIKCTKSGWVSTPKNGLEISDLSGKGLMNAIYMPYGNDIVINSDDNGNFRFSRAYNGLFYLAEEVPYTVEDNELKGAIDLSAPALEGDEKYIHFDISGYDQHRYMMYQNSVKPLTIGGMNSFFQLKYQSGSSGDAIEGYIDDNNGMVSFSGILDASAVGKSIDYEFSINDLTDKVLYTRDAGVRTLSESKYIGIGDISNANRWNAMEYVVLTTLGGSDFCWAKRNLGATKERGEGSYGYYFAKGDLIGYPLEGTFKHYTCAHDFSTSPTGTPADDPAHYALKGLWRKPTYNEMHMLLDLFNDEDSGVYWIRQGTHGSLSFGHLFVNDNTGASVFIPGSGYVDGSTPTAQGQYGEYWTSEYNNILTSQNAVKVEYNSFKNCGLTIRPVFTVKSL